MEMLLAKCKYAHSRNLVENNQKKHRLLDKKDILDGFKIFIKNPEIEERKKSAKYMKQSRKRVSNVKRSKKQNAGRQNAQIIANGGESCAGIFNKFELMYARPLRTIGGVNTDSCECSHIHIHIFVAVQFSISQ